MMLAAVDQGLGTVIYTPGDKDFLNNILKVPSNYDPQVILPVGYPLVEPQENSTKQTRLEFEAKRPEIIPDSNKHDGSKVQKSNIDRIEENNTENKCACGCGKIVVSLNTRRKFIQGHSKFGENGLHAVLRTPPKCKCGCSQDTEWNWDKMAWKKYIDRHIGIRKARERSSKKLNQFELFK
ncbi:hypothetical protein ACFL5P_01645, partial [candidate division KSB1 bacterium]